MLGRGTAQKAVAVRVLGLASAVLLVSWLTGCGGSSGGGGGGNVTGGSPVRSVITQQNWQLEALQAGFVDISVTGSGSGTLDATVEWTFASNDVDLYLTALSCGEDAFLLGQCTILASAESTTTKPERITYNISSGGSFRFWIANFGPERESGTIEVGLTQ